MVSEICLFSLGGMMVNVHFVLLVFAFVLFVCAAAGVPSPPRFNLLAAGLACWVATLIFLRTR